MASLNLNEAGAGLFEFVQAVIISSIHNAKQCSWLESDASCVDILNQLAKHIRLKFFNDQCLMFLNLEVGQNCQINWN